VDAADPESRFSSFNVRPEIAIDMSKATKIVLGTIGVSALLSIGIVINLVLFSA
jgi:hypothetical protein